MLQWLLPLAEYSKLASSSHCSQVLPQSSSLGQDPSLANKKLGFCKEPGKSSWGLCLSGSQRSTGRFSERERKQASRGERRPFTGSKENFFWVGVPFTWGPYLEERVGISLAAQVVSLQIQSPFLLRLNLF